MGDFSLITVFYRKWVLYLKGGLKTQISVKEKAASYGGLPLVLIFKCTTH